jgi:hypothetical protein
MINVVGAYVLSTVVLGGYCVSLVVRTNKAKRAKAESSAS